MHLLQPYCNLTLVQCFEETHQVQIRSNQIKKNCDVFPLTMVARKMYRKHINIQLNQGGRFLTWLARKSGARGPSQRCLYTLLFAYKNFIVPMQQSMFSNWFKKTTRSPSEFCIAVTFLAQEIAYVDVSTVQYNQLSWCAKGHMIVVWQEICS